MGWVGSTLSTIHRYISSSTRRWIVVLILRSLKCNLIAVIVGIRHGWCFAQWLTCLRAVVSRLYISNIYNVQPKGGFLALQSYTSNYISIFELEVFWALKIYSIVSPKWCLLAFLSSSELCRVARKCKQHTSPSLAHPHTANHIAAYN